MEKKVSTSVDLEIFNSLRDTLDIAIVRSSNEGFISMNPAALLLFGFKTIKDARYYPRKMMFADSDIFQHINTKLSVVGSVRNERVLFKKQDQTNFWGKLTSIQKTIDGQLIFDEKIIDITLEVEQEHRLAEKSNLLEKVSNELDRFIYSASHDLRSPITTVLGLVQLMKLSKSAIDDEYLEMMEQALRRLESHIQKLVDFSKNTNERVLSEKIDFKEQLHHILTDLGDHPHYKKNSVDYEIIGNCAIYSDTSKIKSMLYHILKNCFDYTDMNKSNSFISIRIFQSQEKFRIEIIDNGIGILKEHIPHVCQIFYRATTRSKGSGLGLYVAKEAINRISGWIEIESEHGIGTSIKITIPNSENK